MNKIIAIAIFLFLYGYSTAHAYDEHDFTKPGWGTQPVTQQDGDIPQTSSVTLTTTPSLVSAAVTNRTRRRICIQNYGANQVAIGSSTVAASNNWVLGVVTDSALSNEFCTHNTGAIYANTVAGVSVIHVWIDKAFLP